MPCLACTLLSLYLVLVILGTAYTPLHFWKKLFCTLRQCFGLHCALILCPSVCLIAIEFTPFQFHILLFLSQDRYAGIIIRCLIGMFSLLWIRPREPQSPQHSVTTEEHKSRYSSLAKLTIFITTVYDVYGHLLCINLYIHCKNFSVTLTILHGYLSCTFALSISGTQVIYRMLKISFKKCEG